MNTRIAVISAALLLAAGARAAEPPASPTAEAPTAPVRSREPAQSGEPRPEQAPVAGTEDERFKPSEKISEDLSVSFPADI
jgi:hypothetical protein